MSVSVLTRALTLVGLFFEKRSYKRDEARRSEVRGGAGVPWEGPIARSPPAREFRCPKSTFVCFLNLTESI